jgi:hypothetical protein
MALKHKLKVNIKSVKLDFTVPTGSADICFLDLQQGNAMWGGGSHPLILQTLLPFPVEF